MTSDAVKPNIPNTNETAPPMNQSFLFLIPLEDPSTMDRMIPLPTDNSYTASGYFCVSVLMPIWIRPIETESRRKTDGLIVGLMRTSTEDPMRSTED